MGSITWEVMGAEHDKVKKTGQRAVRERKSRHYFLNCLQ
jgi:hypothetical protein